MKQEQLLLASDLISEVEDHYLTLLKNCSSDEFFYKPSPKRWSAAQCLDHLNVINRKLIPAIETKLDRLLTNQSGSPEKVSYSVVDSLLIWSMKSNFKIPAPGAYSPNPDASQSQVISEFERFLERWQNIIHRSKSLQISGVFISSPAISLMKLSILGWIVSSAYHTRRHCIQAEKTISILK